jgi:hypothetical protein
MRGRHRHSGRTCCSQEVTSRQLQARHGSDLHCVRVGPDAGITDTRYSHRGPSSTRAAILCGSLANAFSFSSIPRPGASGTSSHSREYGKDLGIKSPWRADWEMGRGTRMAASPEGRRGQAEEHRAPTSVPLDAQRGRSLAQHVPGLGRHEGDRDGWLSVEFCTLRQTIIETLRPYPYAKDRVESGSYLEESSENPTDSMPGQRSLSALWRYDHSRSCPYSLRRLSVDTGPPFGRWAALSWFS